MHGNTCLFPSKPRNNFGGLSKNDVIEGAVNSVLSGCEILKAKIIEDDFAKKLKDRVTKMYDKCKDWGEVR